jgi:regulator of sirC expression with transglutaminase-like and TPR domain
MSRLVAVVGALAMFVALPAVAGPVEDAAALRKKGKRTEAVALLEKAAETAPKDCALSKALGEAYYDANDADMGAMTWERFLKECPKDPAAGEIAKRLAEHYDKKMDPHPEARAGADDVRPGTLYLVPLPQGKERGGGTEDDRWALENDSRVVKLGPVEDAIEHLRVGKFTDAVNILEAQVKKKPGDDQAWRYLGTARAQAGDKAGAVKAYEKYLELSPKAPDAEPIRRSIKSVKK